MAEKEAEIAAIKAAGAEADEPAAAEPPQAAAPDEAGAPPA